MIRHCNKCGRNVPAENFYKKRSYCIPCELRYTREYAKLNPDIRKKNNQRWRAKNRPIVNKWAATYRNKNKDKIRELHRRWSANNKEAKRLGTRRWIEANKERWIATKRAWEKANPEVGKNSRHKRRVRLGEGEDCSRKIKLLQLERFCHWCCIRLTDKNRTIDHVIPLSRGGGHINDNLVSACRRCNFSKHAKLLEEWDWEAAA